MAQAGVVVSEREQNADLAVDAGEDNCAICLDPISAGRQSALECSHVFHKDCIERLCRQDRRSGGLISCPKCRHMSNILEVDGFDGVVVLPVPRRILSGQSYVSIGLHAYLESYQTTRVTDVLVTLAEDILRLRLPPYSVPTGWAEYVEHVRRLRPRQVEDTVWLPVLSREERARDKLDAWSVEMHRPGRQGPFPPFPWPMQHSSRHVQAVTNGNCPRDAPYVCCGLSVNAVDGTRLPCERCTDGMIHHNCAENIARMSRREVGDDVVMPCPRCGEVYQLAELIVFARTNPRPLPNRISRQDDDVDRAPEDNETMAEYVSRQARTGQPHYDLAVDVRADVFRERWPPYAPPQGWSECVTALRAASENARRGLYEEAHFMVLRGCGWYESIREWASAVRFWARRIEQQETAGGFPEFPTAENRSASPQSSVDGEVSMAERSEEIHRPTARANEGARQQHEV